MAVVRRASIALTALVAALALVLVLTLGRHALDTHQATAQPPATPFKGFLQPPGLRAADFALRDQAGRLVTLHQFRGRPVVVTFMYTRCKNTCPLTAQAIRGALNELPHAGRGVAVLAISVEPAKPRRPGAQHDTPASARHFLTEQHVAGKIDFLLGSQRVLAKVWHDYAVAPHRGEGELDHTAVTYLIDRRGVSRVSFPSGQLVPEDMSHDLRLLLAARA